MPGPPRVILSNTSNYTLEYDDRGSGADLDGSFYRPVAPAGWFLLGGYAQGNYSTPIGPSLIVQVEDDDGRNPILKAPDDYRQIWADHGSGADRDGSIWYPVPPNGYVTLGFVAQAGYGKPSISNFRCVRQDYARPGQFGNLIWWDKGSGADGDVAAYAVLDENGHDTNFYYAQPNYNGPQGQAWTIATSPKG
jgi:hypothetical protein